jgi:hypothetical protein
MPKVTGQDLRLQIEELNALRQLPSYDHKDPDAVAQRINDYFTFCAEHERKPTVEAMALSLGITRQALFVWENKDDERGAIVRQAKALLNALLIEWGIEGRVNPVTMIFLSKNNHGYKDNVQIEAGRIGEENLPTKEKIVSDLQEVLASTDKSNLLTREQIIASLPTND